MGRLSEQHNSGISNTPHQGVEICGFNGLYWYSRNRDCLGQNRLNRGCFRWPISALFPASGAHPSSPMRGTKPNIGYIF